MGETDKQLKKLTLVTDAQKEVHEEMRNAQKSIGSRIQKQELAIEKLRGTLSDSMGRSFFGETVVGNVLTLGMVDTLDQHNDPINKEIDAENKKLQAMKARMMAFNAGEESAVTGKEGETTEDRVDQENQRKAASSTACRCYCASY